MVDGKSELSGSDPKIITPTFVMGWIANFLQFLVFYSLVTTMALYAMTEFGASNTMGGLAASSFVIGATASRLFTGYFVDRMGSRRVTLVAVAVTTVIVAIYIPADSLAVLLVVRFLHGFAYSFATTAIMTMIQSIIPAQRRSEGTGYLSLGTTFAAAVGPAFSLMMVNQFSYTALFAVTIAISVIGLIAAIVLYRRTGGGVVPNGGPAKFSLRSIINPKVLPIAIFMLIIAFSYSGIMTYVNAYADERNLLTGAAFFFIAYAVTMFLSRAYLGKLQDRRGDNIVIAIGLICFIASLLLLAVAHQNWMVIVAGGFSGLGYGALMPAAQSIAVGSADLHEFGSVLSTFFLMVDLGFGFGPIVLGAILGWVSFGTLYLMLAGVIVLAGVYYVFAHGRTDRARGALAN